MSAGRSFSHRAIWVAFLLLVCAPIYVGAISLLIVAEAHAQTLVPNIAGSLFSDPGQIHESAVLSPGNYGVRYSVGVNAMATAGESGFGIFVLLLFYPVPIALSTVLFCYVLFKCTSGLQRAIDRGNSSVPYLTSDAALGFAMFSIFVLVWACLLFDSHATRFQFANVCVRPAAVVVNAYWYGGWVSLVAFIVIGRMAWRRSGETKLRPAAAQGRLEVVMRLLSTGSDINAQESADALFWASRNGHLEVVRALLANGINVDSRRDGLCHETALMAALEKGCLAVAQALIENGANVNAIDDLGNTALIRASAGGHLAVVQTLLNKGANVHARRSGGMTALQAAKLGGHSDVKSFLMKAGAKP